MNTIRTLQAAVIVAATMTSGLALAHGDSNVDPNDNPTTVTLIYTNAAYTHAIHGSPNPAQEVVVGKPDPIYVSQAAGPAIYSYPGVDAEGDRYVCER